MFTSAFTLKILYLMSLISDANIDYSYMIKQFAADNGMVTASGISFEDCNFKGPWLAMPHDCKLTNCRIQRNGTTILLSGKVNATGTFVFNNCLFNNCSFDLVQFAGDAKLVASLPS